ncbi:hypothetical protein [Marinigracilibium pacificum]|uniref:Lipoprotein n=1 Tax=Marinigracilibium pacificum TaxID=2729599 RepID=A0A848IR24_9BACT|nr:hypothetical protein [Marinigracilibium pacificum]NMM46913.1 hypothetical protein [Marinigracilibium pacificum]
MKCFLRLGVFTIFFLICGCKTTKITKSAGILSLTKSDVILINTLPVEGYQAVRLYKSAKEKLTKAGIKEVIYLPEVEFQLLASGIKYDDLKTVPLKESTRNRISEVLDVDYILEAKLNKVKPGSTFGYVSSNSDLQKKDPTTSEAELEFLVSNLENSALDYKFSVSTTISGFGYQDDDGDMRLVNLSSSQISILSKSFDDGVKEITKSVID